MNRIIPLVDLSHFQAGTSSEQSQFVEALGNAFQTIGFVGVTQHGIPQQLVTSYYEAANAFFALPLAVKRKYEIPNLAGQRGYTSFGKEHAKGSNIADLKEFFQVGQTVTDDDPIKDKYPPNVEVAEVEAFTTLSVALYKAFEHTGKVILQAIALYLELDKHYFDSKVHNGNSILRAIHYPPILTEPASAIRAEQHEDINLITLLVGASAGGLQLLNRQNEWLEIVPEADEIVVNVGDMLQRLTNDYLKSTTHRVVNPPRASWHLPRLSIPFFLHPRMEMDLACLPQFVTSDYPKKYEPITAIAYLEERLKEIGLKK
ncbi:MAG: isopenicillin N synthase family oxygenase [Saprospiraceae bacterium]|nr:isopenicillin N synthase family oxygenase [Saprospiraceae bacterium]